jgi:hypothetical protein
MAGIWRPALPDWPESFAIITCESDADLAPYEDRKSIFLLPERWGEWLSGRAPEEDVLKPAPAGSLAVTRVGSDGAKEIVDIPRPLLGAVPILVLLSMDGSRRLWSPSSSLTSRSRSRLHNAIFVTRLVDCRASMDVKPRRLLRGLAPALDHEKVLKPALDRIKLITQPVANLCPHVPILRDPFHFQVAMEVDAERLHLPFVHEHDGRPAP